MNSMYVLVMNLGGDGKDTHPFLTDAGALDCPLSGSEFDPSHTLNYHVARLDQWRAVLEHANAKGISSSPSRTATSGGSGRTSRTADRAIT